MEDNEVAGFLISMLIILVIIVLFVFGSFYIVKPGQRAIVMTWGKADPTPQAEGLHFKMPVAQSVVKMNVQTQKYEADASAASKDLQIVTAHIATNYHLIPEKVVEIYSTLGLGYSDSIIQPMEQELVKATTAKYTAEELITKREEVRIEIKQVFKERMAERGIIVEEVSITNFDFSPSFNQAIESKVTALQLKQKAQNDLERIKIEAEQVAAQAEGAKQAQILSADGSKQSAILQAEGQAKSIQLINDQLKNSPQYLDYYKLQRWNGQVSQVVGASATPLIQVN